jgi:hypothetical protein
MRLMLTALTLTVLLANSAKSCADELQVKIVKQFGNGGPAHGDTYYPGDSVYFRVLVSGLEPDKTGEVSVRFQYDVRSGDDRLIANIADAETSHRPTWAEGRFIPSGFIRLPADAAGKEFQIVVVVTDRLADKQTEARSTVSVRDAARIVPVNVRFSKEPDGRTTSPGRFVEGDGAYLHFDVGGVESLKAESRVICSVAFFEDGERPVALRHPAEFSFLGSVAKPHPGAPIPANYRFNADRKFKGFARLTVRMSDEDEGNSVNIPFEVTDPLE